MRSTALATRRARFRPGLEELESRELLSNVLTSHNDLFRTGQNLAETILSPSNVHSTTFGKLASYGVDGQVYTQPLYVAGLTLPDGGSHNVVFLGTEHDSVYAFDANGGGQLWRTSFIDPANGVTPVPSSEMGSNDISPEVGITGTPVIDPDTNTLYVVAKTKEVRGDGTHYVQRIHALDITTGNEVVAPALIGDTTPTDVNDSPVSVPGTGDGSSNGVLTFNARVENERPGLLLLNGVVYSSYASPGDRFPYHGWFLGHDAATLGLVSALCTTPNAGQGGIWMSGGAPAVDSNGNILLATGNGRFSAASPGPHAIGSNGNGLGYQGIAGSAAVTFRSYLTSSTGLGTNGQFLTPNDLTGTGIDFNAAAHANPPHTFRATLSYDQATTTLAETLTDLDTNAMVNFNYAVDLAAQVGGGTAYVGFTGATGGFNAAHDVLTWTYDNGSVHTIDHSAGFADHSDLTNNGSATYIGTLARLTAAQNSQAGSIFSTAPVDITNFTTTFTFQMTAGSNPIADGLTFTVQNAPGGVDYGESVLSLSPGDLAVQDYFTPFNWQALNAGDTDFGSSGVMLLPDQPGDHPHLMVAAGKEGKLYLLDRDRLGGNNPTFDDVVQTLPGAITGAFDTPAYFDSGTPDGRFVYYATSGDFLKAFRIQGGLLSTSAVSHSNQSFTHPGATPSVSANGTADGIVWIVQKGTPGVLRAYDAVNLANELYDSNQAGDRDVLGNSIKFAPPTIADGQVFVGTEDALVIYGLLPSIPVAALVHAVTPPAPVHAPPASELVPAAPEHRAAVIESPARSAVVEAHRLAVGAPETADAFWLAGDLWPLV